MTTLEITLSFLTAVAIHRTLHLLDALLLRSLFKSTEATADLLMLHDDFRRY